MHRQLPAVHVTHMDQLPAGELPVLLAVEAAAGRRMTVYAEASILDTLLQHRLAELRSTGANSLTAVMMALGRHATAASAAAALAVGCFTAQAAVDEM